MYLYLEYILCKSIMHSINFYITFLNRKNNIFVLHGCLIFSGLHCPGFITWVEAMRKGISLYFLIMLTQFKSRLFHFYYQNSRHLSGAYICESGFIFEHGIHCYKRYKKILAITICLIHRHSQMNSFMNCSSFALEQDTFSMVCTVYTLWPTIVVYTTHSTVNIDWWDIFSCHIIDQFKLF